MVNTKSRTGTRGRTLRRHTKAISLRKAGAEPQRITMYNARVTVRDAEGHADKRWLTTDIEYRDVLHGEFGLNISDQEIDQCLAIMRAKGRVMLRTRSLLDAQRVTVAHVSFGSHSRPGRNR
jgi:hypothetical protein